MGLTAAGIGGRRDFGENAPIVSLCPSSGFREDRVSSSIPGYSYGGYASHGVGARGPPGGQRLSESRRMLTPRGGRGRRRGRDGVSEAMDGNQRRAQTGARWPKPKLLKL